VARADAVLPGARYVLFSDADIDHGRDALRRLVARAQADRLDMASVMVMLSVAVIVAPFGLVAYGLMCRACLPTIRLYRQPWAAALLAPFGAAVYMAMTMGSAWAAWRGRGGAWKGRVYPPGTK
jgi:hypothetical protein